MDFFVEKALESLPPEQEFAGMHQANIKVIGVGGAGNNMVGWLYKKGIRGAEIIATNTDYQHLSITGADHKFLIGKDCMKSSDMVFVCAGMGGGTGTGAAPVVAQVAKDTGAIVIGTVTMPFNIERARCDKAEFGLQQLRQVSDTVIVIDNNMLVQIAGNLPIQQAFAVANELVATMIKGIVET